MRGGAVPREGVEEIEKDSKGSEGIRRDSKRFGGIRRDSKGFEGIQRDSEGFERPAFRTVVRAWRLDSRVKAA